MRMFFLSAALFYVAGTAQAATLNVVGGVLMGASGVDVGGTFYDVQFQSGTCIDLFNGCDALSDFTFNSLASATLASQALLDQVFLDGAEGNFDTQPELATGCTNPQNCFALTPYSGLGFTGSLPGNHRVLTSNAKNLRVSAGIDYVDALDLGLFAGTDLSGFSFVTFAVFSPATPVPEPTTALLLGLGLTGLAGKGRKRNRS